jgi:hypothetical protein
MRSSPVVLAEMLALAGFLSLTWIVPSGVALSLYVIDALLLLSDIKLSPPSGDLMGA